MYLVEVIGDLDSLGGSGGAEWRLVEQSIHFKSFLRQKSNGSGGPGFGKALIQWFFHLMALPRSLPRPL